MQDVETRSIIFLALPPKNTGGWTEAEMAEQVNAVLQRFLEQAEACAEEAENLINGETSPEEGIDEDAIQQVLSDSLFCLRGIDTIKQVNVNYPDHFGRLYLKSCIF